MEHRRRDYAAELRASAVPVVPAEEHPLQQPVVVAGGDASSGVGASAPQTPAPKAQHVAPVQFDDPLQSALAEDDPLGAFAKGAGRAVVDNTPIGVFTKSEPETSQSERT